MKHKTTYYLLASIALLIFVGLGYLVRFYPQALSGVDQTVQSAIRGGLPTFLTNLARFITLFGNTSSQLIIVAIFTLVMLVKKYYSEMLYMDFNAVVASLLIVGLKHLYHRPRPSISHLVSASGFSFPSGHSLGSVVIFGTIGIVLWQHLHRSWQRYSVSILLALATVMIGLSRIYLGVHYPSDVLAGFVLGLALLLGTFPTYERLRFNLRFRSKQR